MYQKKPLRRERRGQLGKKLIQPPLRSGTKLSHPVKSVVSNPPNSFLRATFKVYYKKPRMQNFDAYFIYFFYGPIKQQFLTELFACPFALRGPAL